MARKKAWKPQMGSLYPLPKVDYHPKIDGVNMIEAFGSVEPTSYPSLPPECLEDPPHPESMVFIYLFFVNDLL